jgi:hypothetical protein
MRLFSIVALLIGLSWNPAHSRTLLEDVLYVVIAIDERDDDKYRKTTIVQDGSTLHSETVLVGAEPRPMVDVTIRRVDACRFDVISKLGNDGPVSAHYVVDFADADFEGAHPTHARNFAGRMVEAISIPGSQYCLVHGQPYFNQTAAGTCTREFYVDFIRVPRLQGIEKMLAAIRRLRTHCIPELS